MVLMTDIDSGSEGDLGDQFANLSHNPHSSSGAK